MLAEAADKAPGVPLVEADVRALPRLGAFDLVLCANDVLNYLLDATEVAAALAGAARNLAPGGVLVFDANTLGTFRDTFATTHERTQGELTFAWHGHAAPGFAPGGIARADLVLGELTSVHLQRHHPREEIAAALDAAGLAYDSADATMQPTSTVPLGSAEDAKKVLRLLDALDEHDDVQAVHANFDIPDDVLQAVEA
jgi:SAM-dependent methyltransferase